MIPQAAATRVITGIAAAPGLAAGPLVRIRSDNVSGASSTTCHSVVDLGAAIARTIGHLEALASRHEGGAAADLLEFQIAYLSDSALIDPVITAAAAGEPLRAAWVRRLDAEAAAMAGADAAYFRARAADIADLRDRVLAELDGIPTRPNRPTTAAIFVAEDLAPSLLLDMPWVKGDGLCLAAGSRLGHVAILARDLGLPLVVGAGSIEGHDGTSALLDGTAGTLWLDPSEAEFLDFAARRPAPVADDEAIQNASGPALTASGERIELMLTISGPRDLDGLDPACCDGIGLLRSEFLIGEADILRDESAQLALYAEVLRWAGGRRVVIRTLDAGGDKPVPGIAMPPQTNPALGLRGIRLSLRHRDLFAIQLRALLRAAALGPLDVMLPMVTLPSEFDAAIAFVHRLRSELTAQGIPHGLPRLGLMVEVPAAGLLLDQFAADFASIGSNDLSQYLLATSRDAPDPSGLMAEAHTATLPFVAMVVATARRTGLPLSLCGDAAGDAVQLNALLSMGLRSFSVPPRLIGRVRSDLSRIRLEDKT